MFIPWIRLQTTARRNQVPIDQLTWEFPVLTLEEANIEDAPSEGVYIKGMYLEGAGWDLTRQCLCEPNNMELIVTLPIIHFKVLELQNLSAEASPL